MLSQSFGNVQIDILGSMIFTLDGNSEIGKDVGSNPCYLAYVRHLNRSRVVTKRIFSLRNDLFSFMREQQFLSYHLI